MTLELLKILNALSDGFNGCRVISRSSLHSIATGDGFEPCPEHLTFASSASLVKGKSKAKEQLSGQIKTLKTTVVKAQFAGLVRKGKLSKAEMDKINFEDIAAMEPASQKVLSSVILLSLTIVCYLDVPVDWGSCLPRLAIS